VSEPGRASETKPPRSTDKNAASEPFSTGWTDKQLPCAYDLDGDGGHELVAHWGVLHPEQGPGSLKLSTMLAAGESLHREADYDEQVKIMGRIMISTD
jgi:hypothetical protein